MKTFLKNNWHKLVIAGGIIIIALGIFLHLRERAITKNLLIARGAVIQTEVRSTHLARYSGTAYHAYIKYRYEVDGKTYEADKVALAESYYETPEEAKKFIDQYPVGSSVDVHYDKREPNRAYLDVEGPNNGTIVIVLGVLFTIIAVPISLWAKKRLSTIST